MLNYDEDLTELVESLICTGREDDWWDFKECYHEDRAALLHDIICLANNRADRDTYLILGVREIRHLKSWVSKMTLTEEINRT